MFVCIVVRLVLYYSIQSRIRYRPHVTVRPTEDNDLEVEAVIVREGTGRVRPVGDPGREIVGRAPETDVPETGDPDLGQTDGPVLPEEDQGIGNYMLSLTCRSGCASKSAGTGTSLSDICPLPACFYLIRQIL